MPNATKLYDDSGTDDETDDDMPGADHSLPLRALLQILDAMHAEYVGTGGIWHDGRPGFAAADEWLRFKSGDDDTSDTPRRERVLH